MSSPAEPAPTRRSDGDEPSLRPTAWALRERPRIFELVSAGVIVVLVALVAYPLVRVFLATFVVHGHLDLGPLLRGFRDQPVGRLALNTALVALPATFVALVLGFGLAWLNERTDARVGPLADFLPLFSLFLPPIAGAIGWVYLLDPRAGFANSVMRSAAALVGVHSTDGPVNIYSWGGLIFVYTLYLVPFAYLMISSGLRTLDPRLEEQARVCGSGKLRTFVHVTLPAIKPSLAGAALLMLIFAFGLFSVPRVIGTQANVQVLSVGMVNLMTASYPPNTGGAIALALITIAITGGVWYLQVRLVGAGRFATIGGKAHARSVMRIGWWRWPARLVLVVYVGVAAILPIVALLLVALNGYWTTHIAWSSLGFRAFRQTLGDITTQQALGNSVKLALAGAIIGIAMMTVASVAVRGSRSRAARAASGVLKLPAAISPIIFAIGFILALAGPPFGLGGTLVILLLAFIIVFMPWASIATDTAAAQVGPELLEASRAAGAGGLRTLVRINLPLMLPSLVAGAALLFVLMMGDIEVSIMLAGYSNETVGFQILSIFSNSSWSQLAALAVVLTAISIVVVGAVRVGVGRWTRW